MATYFFELAGNDADPGTEAQPFQTQGKAESVALSEGDIIVRLDAPTPPVNFVSPPSGSTKQAWIRQGGSFVQKRYNLQR